MSKWKFTLCLFATEIIQSTILARLPIFDARPNMSLALVVALSILYGDKLGSYTGLGLGLVEDVVHAQVLGIRALIYFITGHLIGRAMQNTSSFLPSGIFITMLATIAGTILNLLIYYLLAGQPTGLSYLMGPVFVEAVLNGLLFVLVMYLLKKILKPESVRKYSGY